MDFVEQTFDIRLFDDDKGPLNKATDMLRMINKMGEDGKKHERKCRELEGTLGDGKWMETFVAKVFSKHYDSGLLSIVHHGNYNSHFGVDQILQNEVNCGIFGSGFSITPTCASHLTTAMAGREYVHYMPDISHWIPIFRHDQQITP